MKSTAAAVLNQLVFPIGERKFQKEDRQPKQPLSPVVKIQVGGGGARCGVINSDYVPGGRGGGRREAKSSERGLKDHAPARACPG